MPTSTVIVMIISIVLNVGGFIWGIGKIISVQKREKQKH